jgi:flagellar protein FlaH
LRGVYLSNVENDEFLSFSNPQLDRKIGGLPVPTMTLIEGTNDSGKSVLSQQIVYGAVKDGNKVLLVTTESSPQKIIENMLSLSWDVGMSFILGKLKIVQIDALNVKWNPESSNYLLITLLNYMRRNIENYNLIIIDSLSTFLSNSDNKDILNFFSSCKELIDRHKVSYVITIHSYAVNSEVFRRIRDICDGHLLMEKKTFRERTVLTINIIKLKGANLKSSEMISFETSEVQGIKILPFTSTRG